MQRRRKKTPLEKIAEAERKAQTAEAALKKHKATVAAEYAKLKKQENRDREHKKFIIGGAILAEIEADPHGELSKATLPAILQRRVTAPKQREFLEPPPLPKKKKATPNNDNLSDKFPPPET